MAVSTLMLLRALTRKQRRWWVGYAAALIVVGYFHLLSLLVVPGQLIAVLVIGSRELPRFAVALAAVFVAVIPVAILGFVQRGQIGWIPLARFDYLWTGLSALTGSLTVTACLAVIVAVSRGDRRLVALGLSTALATPVLLWALGLFTPLYLVRYLLGATPGIAILVAGALTSTGNARVFVLAAILAGLVMPQQFAVRTPAAHNQDYRGAAELVATDCAARIEFDGMSKDAMEYYLGPKPCAPSETAQSNHLWVVQAAGPQVTETRYTLVRASSFGMAIVTYWTAK